VDTETKKRVLREFTNNGRNLQRLTIAITICVRDSFKEDLRRASLVTPRMLNPTTSDIRDRTLLCYDWFIRLRGDLSYGFEKAVDTLPRALRHELDGDDWTPPPADKSWGVRVAGGG